MSLMAWRVCAVRAVRKAQPERRQRTAAFTALERVQVDVALASPLVGDRPSCFVRGPAPEETASHVVN